MTAIADPPPLAVDPPAPRSFAMPVPVATICADLLPDEIRVRRRLGYLKRRLVFVMIALVALVVLGDLLVRQQTTAASSDLAGANNHIATLNLQLGKFNTVLTTRSDTQAIWGQLDGAMGDDVSWLAVLNELLSPLPTGAHVAVTAAVDDTSSAGGTSTGSTTLVVPDAIGSVTVTGQARRWQDVATYVRRLSAVKGFAAVNPSTVSHGSADPTTPGTTTSGVMFTITLDITSAALDHRFAASTGAPSTKPATTFPGTSGTSTGSGAGSPGGLPSAVRTGTKSGSGTTARPGSATGKGATTGSTTRTGSTKSTGSTRTTKTTRTAGTHTAGNRADPAQGSQESS